MAAPQTSLTSHDVLDSSIPHEEKFAKSGLTITDDSITLDISSSTGLRKTGFSDQIYSTRRRSVENLCVTETGLPLMRSIPQYRSVRKPTTSSTAKEMVKENTWSGRTTKNRPSLSKPNSPSPSRRIPTNTGVGSRSAGAMQYDQNGRRIKPISASANTSPIKTRITSPLAQQFLEVAGEAKDDAQFLAKMKALLAQYSKNETAYDDDDFTTAWVNGNGTVERAKAAASKVTTKKTSSQQASPKEIPNVLNSRRSSGLSRIPAPVRANTGLY